MFGVTRLDIQEKIALISFSSVPTRLCVTSEIFTRFADENIIIDMISQTAPVSGNASISFTCLESDMVKVLEASKSLAVKHESLLPMVSAGNAKISLYGADMPKMPGVFAKALDCLCKAGVELRQISTSEVDISLLVEAAHLDDAATALKTAFDLPRTV